MCVAACAKLKLISSDGGKGSKGNRRAHPVIVGPLVTIAD
jgi:hypothetical protein